MAKSAGKPPEERATVLLIDGFSLLYRAFYALPELETADGTPTQAVYGFTLMLMNLLEEERPEFIAVVVDREGPTFRDEMYAEYKAQRPAMPDGLRTQVPLFYELLAGFNIPVLGADGYEADDCIGTAAAKAAEAGYRTVVVTGDRDCLQLVDDAVEVVLTRRGIKDTERLTTAGVKEKLGVFPHQVPDFRALTGDSSDNIPGVPGVGPKTAARWLERFGTVEELLAHAGDIPGKAGEALRAHEEQVRLSKRLATIVRDVPLDVAWEDLRRREPDWRRLIPLLERLEFHSLLKRLDTRRRAADGQQPPPGGAAAPARAAGPGSSAPTGGADPAGDGAGTAGLLASPEALEGFLERLGRAEAVTVVPVLEGDHPLGIQLKGAAFVWEGGGAAIPFEGGGLPRDRLVRVLELACGDPARETATPDAKALIHALRPWGVALAAPYQDIALAAYLLRPGEGPIRPEAVIKQALGEDSGPAPAMGSPDFLRFADALRRAWPALWEQMRQDGLLPLYQDVELPLVEVLADMEYQGVPVDPGYLRVMGDKLAARLEAVAEAIYGLAGESFNLNSPRQLAAVLYDKLGLPVLKRTKTGPSTSADVLEELADQHELPRMLLEYRQLAKLKNTYVDTLPGLVHPETGRIHTNFNQTVTATGRLSSTHPNLQNIPVRTEEGRLIRAAFVAGDEGMVLLTADYSQIELRILAHLSRDEGMVEAFRQGDDIHARTASEIFGIPRHEITPAQRDAAKAVNFGIIYGISSFGLARGTGLTQAEAQRYIDGYFERYPGVKGYLDQAVAQARQRGYVTTILGRRRYLPDLKSRQWARRQFAERTAMNTPIQGSAADVIKLAMLRVWRRLRSLGLATRLVLQVHDELVFTCPREELQQVGRLVKEEMEGAVSLAVPLVAELRWGLNWKDTQPLVLED